MTMADGASDDECHETRLPGAPSLAALAAEQCTIWLEQRRALYSAAGRTRMTPELRAIVEQIHSSGAVLRRAVEAAPPGRLTRTPSEGEWSALETLTHVRDVIVHVYGLRIRRLLYEDDPVFADFDEESYRRASLARGETAGALLDTIAGEHEQTARLLTALPDTEWARQGRHPVFGVVSIEFLARRIGEHAVEHAAQIAAAHGA
jgi:hypothetical protein